MRQFESVLVMDVDALISNVFTTSEWLHESRELRDRCAAIRLRAEAWKEIGESLLIYYAGDLFNVDFMDCGPGLSFWKIVRRKDGKTQQISSRWGMD